MRPAATGSEAEVVHMLGLKFHKLTASQVLDRVEQFISSGRPHVVCVPNADCVVKAMDDPEYRAIVDGCDLSIPDGIGVMLASRLLGRPVPNVGGQPITGQLAALAAKRGYRLYLFGAGPGVAARAGEVLQERNCGLVIAGTASPSFRLLGDVEESQRAVQSIRQARPDVLLVGLGAPKQEKWIWRYRQELGVPVCVGVGATFDFLAGTQRQPPEWLGRLELRWLYRLVTEPRRLWRRYLIGGPRFVFLVLRDRLTGAKACQSGDWSKALR
ncbi:MAG: WecB/TagA/CpsF family glycosyltransferase [Bacteroidetes bacterium]|nr:WecB/TagA/CpsF family glycosyltransferase [Bacteroidota bacterium]MCL5026213.1 WecB/TagA/CpsF family glycosyltransferase [Chloroflexota bacterium]